MANYCQNSVTFIHKDDEILNRIVNSFLAGGLMQEFLPLSQQNNSTALEEWGTKSDIQGDVIFVNGDSIYIEFQTAWTPPIEFYNKMVQMGIQVDAMYYEPGCGFCGMYNNGIDNYIEFESFDEIPEDIVDQFGIEEEEFF